jgi:membrane protease YdiL (CAAX protease family)
VDGLLKHTPFLTWVYGNDFSEALARKEVYARARYDVWLAVLTFPLRLAAVAGLAAFSNARLYQLGLSGRRIGWDVGLGVISLCALTPFVNTVHGAVAWLWREYVVAPVPHPLEQISQTQPQLIDWLLIFFSAVVTAAVVEELLFRAILQPWFASRSHGGDIALGASVCAAALSVVGPVRAVLTSQGPDLGRSVLIASAPLLFVLALVPAYLLLRQWARSHLANAIFGTSLLWAVFHSNAWPTPISLFLFGVGLGLLYYRTQSLIPPVVTHALFNAVSFAMLAIQSVRHAKGQ